MSTYIEDRGEGIHFNYKEDIQELIAEVQTLQYELTELKRVIVNKGILEDYYI
jgi:hypothetical protein